MYNQQCEKNEMVLGMVHYYYISCTGVIPVARFRRKTVYRPCDFPNTTTCILVFFPLINVYI